MKLELLGGGGRSAIQPCESNFIICQVRTIIRQQKDVEDMVASCVYF